MCVVEVPRNTLNNIGALWGTVLNLEGDISRPESFSYSKVKVVTSCIELINKTINLECKGKLHPILVYEDHLGNSEKTSSSVVEDYSSNVNFCRVVEATPTEECYKEKGDEYEVAARCDLSGAVASPNEVAKRKELTHDYSE
ncbi:hypothetical protein ACSBR2_027045 [Camellia fascicularis]